MPFKRTLWSLFDIHNETGNVWTHLLGFLMFLALTFYVIKLPPQPLAMGKQQLDTLWHSVQDRVHGISDSLHHLHLPHSLGDLSANLHSLQETLHHGVDTLVHGVQEEVQHAAHLLSHGVHHLSDNLHLASGKLQSVLQESLSDVIQWPVPRWPVYVFMSGAMTCLFLSAACHLFGCCAQHITQLIWRFDYAGIAILIVTSFYPPVYYSFMCERFWRVFYLVTTTIMGLAAVAVSLLDAFQRTEWRTFRASMFVCLGIYGAVPLLHASWAHSDIAAIGEATRYDMLMGFLYLSGAFIYAARIPERWLPGRFDVWFHGHQIFHILIVLAALAHYRAVMILLHWRDASGGCAAPVGAPLEAAAHGGAIEQVWESLHQYALEYLGRHVAGGGGGGGAGAGGMPSAGTLDL
ncbi:hypothetical protein HXX76_011195 [Chlamydomonas incerta]|uniref:Uncharacterized protein n=1 Tax=Chlamydomonas incerta TaxID=51695 RepID=A0A835VXS0_CHLIN|nr:hypothetical protein HXX76_011195 [Chlamydomonas incerta]|eukprot:KAG2428951.1 hypothetical protein HXX76_011195 [Chlamydomonas incerta]